MDSMKHLSRILILLVVAGVMISTYLLYKEGDPSSVACSIGGGCEKVLSSEYAKLYGYSIALYGLVWYLTGLALIWLVYIRRIWTKTIFQLWAFSGLFFSLYLLYLEATKIHAYCTWCLISLGLVILITGLSFVKSK